MKIKDFSLASLVDPIAGLVGKFITDKDQANMLAHDIATLAEKQGHAALLVHMEASKAVIVAEANSDSWLTANWRPLIMAMFGLIVANNYLLYPYISLFWDAAPLLELPPDLWALLKIGLGGYVVGRSAEKVAKVWKEPTK